MRNRTLFIALLMIVAIAALTIAAVQLRAPRGPVIYAELSTAPGLREGAPVAFRGIAIGEVAQIAFVPSGVRLTLALTRSDVPLRQADGVRVRPNGFPMGTGLEIVPGPSSARPAQPGVVLHEAPPDAAMLREQAFRDALKRRLEIQVEPNVAPPSKTSQ